ncbi:diphosphoinositol polyphosphate phosphohydrolase 1 isoform X1 [Chiloscyllium plagiosum]|uniref:diphosphoinositol polyphosphate phosphohydrolase 1 isoform X1 n=1 Tax=Chiloscyllium plagiosum TaxID=36176 RepID=UPI001CB7FE15|nr:diphosphoinositol polyphosphate phosphohydrolase 1 isoform X1 [Chiloscyllium plagiosum]
MVSWESIISSLSSQLMKLLVQIAGYQSRRKVLIFIGYWQTLKIETTTQKYKSWHLEVWDSIVLLVSSSRYPDRWIVPGGGMEPDEEPSVAAVREVCEEAGVKGTLGRLVGIFENRDRKHRTYVYVLVITEVLEDWEDSVNIGRKREWFKIDDAIKVLQCHKPVQASYFETFKQGYLANNGTPVVATLSEEKASTYANQSSVSSIR